MFLLVRRPAAIGPHKPGTLSIGLLRRLAAGSPKMSRTCHAMPHDGSVDFFLEGDLHCFLALDPLAAPLDEVRDFRARTVRAGFPLRGLEARD